MIRLNLQKMKAFLKRVKSKEKGAALILSLLVLMVLVLLGLTLILQSQTEYLGAVNENDSLSALSHAESGLEWAERAIKDAAGSAADLDLVLQGPDDTPDVAPGGDDGIIGIRNLSATLTSLLQLNSDCSAGSTTCEQTESVKVDMDWDGDTEMEAYEAFRVGRDDTADGIWDGPRAHLYVRIEDNYDDPTNSGIQDVDDNDFRARVRVMSEYPIFVDSNGTAQDPVLATRGIAVRRLEGRLAPVQGVAIVTNKILDAEGKISVCGSCGGIHSNGDMHFSGGSGQVCADATASGAYTTDGPGPTVGGDWGGGKQTRPVPPINPYDDVFVPMPGTFDHATDAELAQPFPLGTALQCGPPTAVDPGNSKYFALVYKQAAPNFQVYKAYFDHATPGNRWRWRLIDVGPTLTAVLDNCGRLVSSPDLPGGDPGPDPCPAGNLGCDGSGFATYGVNDLPDCCGAPWPVADGGDGNTYCNDPPDCMDPGPDLTLGTKDDINRCRPDGFLSPCDGPNGDDQFYGFKGTGNFTPILTCTSDDSLSGLANNDFVQNDFFVYPGGGNNTDATVPALPGSGSGDSVADFNFAAATRWNRQKWDNDTTVIFSPLYNAVIFIYGNGSFTGDMINGRLQFYDHDPLAPTLPQTISVPNPLGRWRVSPISYGRIDVNAAVRFGPANSGVGDCVNDRADQACNLGMVAGRDLELRGDAGSGCSGDPPPAGCSLCPNLETDPNANCEVSNVVPFGFEGYFVAHEQISLRGNANLAGFLIAEEAAYCVQDNNQDDETNLNGTPDIYYDCENPPNPWAAELLRITSWEEVQ